MNFLLHPASSAPAQGAKTSAQHPTHTSPSWPPQAKREAAWWSPNAQKDADVRIQELDVIGCLISASALIKIEQPLIVHPAVLTLIAKLLIFY